METSEYYGGTYPDEFYEEIFQPDDSKINLDLLYNKIIELKIDKK